MEEFAVQIVNLKVRRDAVRRAERDLTQTVQSYALAGVPLSLMLATLGWSERTYYRRKAALYAWAMGWEPEGSTAGE